MSVSHLGRSRPTDYRNLAVRSVQVERVVKQIAAPLKGVILGSLVLLGSQASAGPGLQDWIGDWHGTATAAGEQTQLSLHIRSTAGSLTASISLGNVGVTGWPVASIKASGDNLSIRLPSDTGMQEMQLRLNDRQLSGTWREAQRPEAAQVRLLKTTHPTEPNEQRIWIPGPAGKIGASVFLPERVAPYPAIVFVHGSGPQPRDANRFAAQRFAELGVASVIFDKRGVGETEGVFEGVSFEDLAADAIAAANYMLTHTLADRVGFVGHSQGGWISTLAGATWEHTAFVISISGPVVPPSREAHWTVVRAMRKQGASEADIEEARAVIDQWHQAVRSGQWQNFYRSLRRARSRDWFKGSQLNGITAKPSKSFAQSYKAYMDYDPLPALNSLQAPFLAILAPNDESIDAKETIELLRGLNKPNLTLRVYAGYDHSLRRLGDNGEILRWPSHPARYFEDQADFILR